MGGANLNDIERSGTTSTNQALLEQVASEASKRKAPADPIGRLYSPQELISLAERLQRELELKSRRDKFRWYSDCFRGSQAVTWLVENTAVDCRDAAVDLGAEMLGRGLIFHVRHRHGFQDKRNRLYRFQVQEDSSNSGDSDAASEASSTGGTAKRRTPGSRYVSPKGDKWSKGQQVTKLQARVLELDIDIEDQKEMQGILLDAISEQIRGMQRITRILTGKLAKANEKASSLEVYLVAAVGLQVLAFLWLSGCRILATGLLVLGINLTYIWYQYRLPDRDPSERTGTEVPEATHALKHLEAQRDLRSPSHSYGSCSEGSSSGNEQAEAQTLAATGMRSIAEEASPCVDSSRHSSTQEIEGRKDSNRAVQTADLEPPSISEVREWRDAPLLVRPKPLAYQTCTNLVKGSVPVNTGRPVEFESDTFKGKAVIWVQGLSTAPPDLFSGQRRKTSITIQGQFKQPAGFDDIVSGQEFSRPAVNLPAKWLVESVLVKKLGVMKGSVPSAMSNRQCTPYGISNEAGNALNQLLEDKGSLKQVARSISPSMSIGPLSSPFLLVPAIAAAQVINVSMPGQEPDPSRPVREDLTAFDSGLVNSKGSPLPWGKRQRLFWNPQMRKDRSYTTEHVWTFVMYQSQVNMSTYGLDVALRYDLTRHLDGQPLQFMMKDRFNEGWSSPNHPPSICDKNLEIVVICRKRDSYLCNFEAWHEKLISIAKEAHRDTRTS